MYGNEKVYPASACLVQQYAGLLNIHHDIILRRRADKALPLVPRQY